MVAPHAYGDLPYAAGSSKEGFSVLANVVLSLCTQLRYATKVNKRNPAVELGIARKPIGD